MSSTPSFWQRSFFSILLGVGLVGCSSLGNFNIALSNPDVSSIGELQKDRGESNIVELKGTVSDRAPFLGSGAYLLQDTTGAVWVMTDKTLPNRGDKVAIRGEVKHQSIAIAQQTSQELYVLEIAQLERVSNPDGQPSENLFLPHKQNDK
ncbi:MAG: hypothetical protein HC820_07680 [Hydrococcus sp. RM1_1_31]|nr:hypothetical protein [Hydrococcus sp. RM1_1_31]